MSNLPAASLLASGAKPTKKIIVATTNKNKLAEWRAVLEPKGYTVVPATEVARELGIDLQDTPENGTSFLENATAKAVAASNAIGRNVWAEDSGLSLRGTNWEWPGLHSNRFLGVRSADGSAERAAIQEKVKKLGDSKARYDIAIVQATPGGKINGRNYRLYGDILPYIEGAAHGGAGAYYPIFKTEGSARSLARELELAAKEKTLPPMTHRRMALERAFKQR